MVKKNDIKIYSFVDPVLFKKNLFEITKFDTQNKKYQFERSKSGGFFMMSLHLSPTYCIGFGPLDSLFNLSTFAHELGHTTTHRERSLEKYFLEYPDECSEEMQVNDEDDSYLYERFFLENIDELMATFKLSLTPGLGKLLLKRKAVQNNVHILKNRMNYLYYSGVSLDEIQKVFSSEIKIINPNFPFKSQYDWLDYSTLDKPLSRIGYIKAYSKIFQ